MAGEEDAHRNWIAARDAVELVAPLYNHSALVRQAIVIEAAGGRIASQADRLEVETEDEEPPVIHGQGPIMATFWRTFKNAGSGRERDDWTTGTFIVRRAAGTLSVQWIRVYGVEFCENDLRKVFRLPARSFAVFPAGALQYATERVASGANPPKRRGPKPKAFWGAAMSAVEASISSGELKPESLADIEHAMSDWIAEQGFDAGESTVRNYAKPIWDRLERGR